ncbi:MAG: DUF4292 domain-containing protein [Bacteroidota bacterium]
MTRFIKQLLVVCFGASLLTSCAKKLTDGGQEKLPKVKATELVAVLDSISKLQPKYFYSKVSTRYQDTTRSNSFKTSIRLTQDSAVHTIISFAGIPLITALVTTDSVLISNKKDKCFIRQPLSYVKENFGVDFDYDNIEELILGLPLDYDTTQKYFQIHDPYNYILSSHKEREIKRNEDDEVVLKYFFTNDIKQLRAIEIESPMDTTKITINYVTREQIGAYSVPKNLNVEIRSPRNHIFIDMEYEKTEVDVPKEMIIIIPESYEKCE